MAIGLASAYSKSKKPVRIIEPTRDDSAPHSVARNVRITKHWIIPMGVSPADSMKRKVTAPGLGGGEPMTTEPARIHAHPVFVPSARVSDRQRE
jgi:hypothetical protein